MSTRPPIPSDLPELSPDERLELAHRRWKEDKNVPVAEIARKHGVPRSTLQGRIDGAVSTTIRQQNQQKLSPEEETALCDWILRLQAWGWPARVEQVRQMAQELLITKGDTKPLGKNWTQKFLSRHNDIRTKFIPPLDKERALAQDSAILSTWFELFLRIKTEYKVEDEDIWNMDEKGVMLGVVPKLKVMISRHEKNKHMTQYGSHEWVSLLECISISGRALRSWIIFKAAVQQKAWNDAYPEAHISTSEKGWTDNEIYLWWIEKCFDKESAIGQKGEYRILCVDGYASHISTAAIEYCITRKIIVLCLPAHTTHLLQPLDVGVFGPLSIAYQNHVQRATRLGPRGSIDKTDFLELYRLAKQDAITSDNIKKAWSATGLSPFDPQIVLKHFPPLEKPEQYEQYNITIRPTSPPEGTITRISKDGESKITMTPANVLQVQRILHQAKAEGIELGDVVQKATGATPGF